MLQDYYRRSGVKAVATSGGGGIVPFFEALVLNTACLDFNTEAHTHKSHSLIQLTFLPHSSSEPLLVKLQKRLPKHDVPSLTLVTV